MKTKLMSAALVAVASLTALSFYAPTAFSQGGSTAPSQAPEANWDKFLNFTLKDAKTGKAVKLADLKGKAKAIYLDFFASWCGPCQRVIPKIVEMDKATKDSDVLFIGVNISDEWDAMQGNIRDKGITYPVYHDPTPRGQAGIASLVGVNAIPTVMILDGQTLQLKQKWVGANPQFEEQQKALLRSLGVPLN